MYLIRLNESLLGYMPPPKLSICLCQWLWSSFSASCLFDVDYIFIYSKLKYNHSIITKSIQIYCNSENNNISPAICEF